MKNEKIKMTLDLIVSKSDIDYIMCCALENGISGWSDDIKACGEYLGEYVFEQISEGGCLLIHDLYGEETYILDREKLMKGIRIFVGKPENRGDLEMAGGHLELDTAYINSFDADEIIQYALFGEIRYV